MAHHLLMFRQFCSLCQNGGEIVACDYCPRVVCTIHMPISQSIEKKVLETLAFRCPSCHIMHDRQMKATTPYMVCTLRSPSV